MISKFLSTSIAGFVLVALASCDSIPETTGFQDSSQILTALQFESDTLSFKQAEVVKDTIVSFSVSVEVSDPDLLGQNPIVSLYEKLGFTVVASDTLIQTNPSLPVYSGSVQFITNTGVSTDAVIIATAKTSAGNPTNFIRRSLPIVGFSIPPATVVQIIAPDTVKIPLSGNVTFLIGAEVTHPDAQRFIKKVLLELISETTGSLGTFNLYDDGSITTTPEGTFSGDQTANDTIYSTAFTISSANNPDVISIVIKAVDTANNESNTLTQTLRIVQ
ncbi:hypothetical protein EP331_13575 [bacterium]|nr:MAG: hypothetical protein EP331_13575 [bacterium]